MWIFQLGLGGKEIKKKTFVGVKIVLLLFTNPEPGPVRKRNLKVTIPKNVPNNFT